VSASRRHGEALSYSLAQDVDVLVNPGRESAQARDVVLVVRRGPERHVRGELRERDVKAVVGGEGNEGAAQRIFVDASRSSRSCTSSVIRF
jgi:hypothetical protein